MSMKVATLGELEKQVMDIVWDKNICSARDVLTELGSGKKFAYTTIATVLQRLYEKGLVKRAESKGGYLYSPKITKKSYSRNIAKSFLNKFIDSFGDTAIASFAESVDELPIERRNYFINLLKNNEKHK